jgi:tetratricopeptide (TPR) repeat protein
MMKRGKPLVVAGLLWACSVMGQQPKASVEELYRQADHAVRAKDYAQAEFWFRQIRADYPQDERWPISLVSLIDAQGRWADAVKVAEEVRPRLKDKDFFYSILGSILTKMGRAEDAIRELQTGLRYSTGPGMTGLLQERIGFAYLQSGRANQAVEAFRKAKEVNRRASLGLALALGSSGDRESEIAEYRAVLRENPNQPVALNNLAYALAEKSEGLNEALGMSQRAVAQSPGNAAFMDTLGWIYFKKGQLPEAEGALIEALLFEGGTQDTLRDHLVAVMDAQGDWSGDRRELRDLVDKGSKPAEIARMKVLLGRAREK